jgi:beta-xylosidase
MWKLALLVLLTSSSLFACGSPATPIPIPTATPVPPTDTAIPPTATATLQPSPTPDPLLFRDDFEGALDPAWHWIAEKPAYWSLTHVPGWLRITARAGGIGQDTATNVLVQPAPQGSFELETKLNFRPGGNYQIAGLLIYESNHSTAFFGRAFCDNPQCARDGYYFDMVTNGAWAGQNYATSAPDVDVVYLRLRREADTYTAYASEDGQAWALIGQHVQPLNPLFVGLWAGQASGSVPRVAAFDYFTIMRPE